MKSTLFFLIVCSIMTLFDAMFEPPRLDRQQKANIHHWIDSLEWQYKQDCVYSRLALELEMKLTSSEMQLSRIKGQLPLSRQTRTEIRQPQVFFTSAQ